MEIIDNRKPMLVLITNLSRGDTFIMDKTLCMITDEVIPRDSRDDYKGSYVVLGDGITDYFIGDEEVSKVRIKVSIEENI